MRRRCGGGLARQTVNGEVLSGLKEEDLDILIQATTVHGDQMEQDHGVVRVDLPGAIENDLIKIDIHFLADIYLLEDLPAV